MVPADFEVVFPVVAVPVTAEVAHWQPEVAGLAVAVPVVVAVVVAAVPAVVVVAGRVAAGTAEADKVAEGIPAAVVDSRREAWVAPGTAADTSAAGIAADTWVAGTEADTWAEAAVAVAAVVFSVEPAPVWA